MRLLKEYTNVTLQEVPGHISLVLSIPGCGMRCPGCHTPEMQDECNGEEVSEEYLDELVERYVSYVSCVTFFGGESRKDILKKFIAKARNKNKDIHFCLYTGRNSIEEDLLKELDYLKIGDYRQELGGLKSEKTNQRFIDLKNNKDLTNKFTEELKCL